MLLLLLLLSKPTAAITYNIYVSPDGAGSVVKSCMDSCPDSMPCRISTDSFINTEGISEGDVCNFILKGGTYAEGLVFAELSVLIQIITYNRASVSLPSIFVNSANSNVTIVDAVLTDVSITALGPLSSFSIVQSSITANVSSLPWQVGTSLFEISNSQITAPPVTSYTRPFINFTSTATSELHISASEVSCVGTIFTGASFNTLTISKSKFTGLSLAHEVLSSVEISESTLSGISNVMSPSLPMSLLRLNISDTILVGTGPQSVLKGAASNEFVLDRVQFYNAPVGPVFSSGTTTLDGCTFQASPVDLTITTSNPQAITITNSDFSRRVVSTDPPNLVAMLALTQLGQLADASRIIIYGNVFEADETATRNAACDLSIGAISTDPISSISVAVLCFGEGSSYLDADLNVTTRLIRNRGVVSTPSLTAGRSGYSRTRPSVWTFSSLINSGIYVTLPNSGVTLRYLATLPDTGMVAEDFSSTFSVPETLAISVGWTPTDRSLHPTAGKSYPLVPQASILGSTGTLQFVTPAMPTSEDSGLDFHWSYAFAFDSLNSRLSFSATFSDYCASSPPVSVQADDWVCRNGQWVLIGKEIEIPSISVGSGPIIIINGSLTVTGDITFTSGSSSINAVNACITINGQVQLELSEEELAALLNNPGPRTLITQQSSSGSCSQQMSSLAIGFKEYKQGCKKLKAKNVGDSNQLIVLFQADSSGCNTRWIILGSVLGGVVLIAVILALIFTLVPAARHCVRPYSKRGNTAL